MHNRNFIDALHYFYFYDSPASQETLQDVIIEQNSRKNKLSPIETMQWPAAESRASRARGIHLPHFVLVDSYH